ncbi:hypothetical protein [Micromonospora sp. NPDC051006]|uniref:hypothetical protein n=1 Tax=Micromonospora sp. NPDC051006 TaxID=3364283 RepID=UPI00378BBDD0
MSDEFLTEDEGRIASLGLAALTAYVHEDDRSAAQVINDHVNAARSPMAGAQDVFNGLLVAAGVLLHKLSKATGKSQDTILQELGVAYAERDPDDQA